MQVKLTLVLQLKLTPIFRGRIQPLIACGCNRTASAENSASNAQRRPARVLYKPVGAKIQAILITLGSQTHYLAAWPVLDHPHAGKSRWSQLTRGAGCLAPKSALPLWPAHALHGYGASSGETPNAAFPQALGFLVPLQRRPFQRTASSRLKAGSLICLTGSPNPWLQSAWWSESICWVWSTGPAEPDRLSLPNPQKSKITSERDDARSLLSLFEHPV